MERYPVQGVRHVQSVIKTWFQQVIQKDGVETMYKITIVIF